MGKSSKEVTVGFRYHMGIQIVGCHGPVDSFNRLIVGEREAWTGSVTDNATINVNKPELFGGDDREGGVVGDIDVMMGGPTQARNTYLANQQGPKCPAYRGLFSLVFKQFLWSSGNPYFKSPWVEVTRCLKGWENDTPWHPEIAMINGKDMNPAHLIYQCFTDSSWGMGYSASDIDDAEWLAAAQQLYNEQFGLSLMWDQQSDIESFVQQVVNHINGAIGVNLSTGKFRLKLIRDDYNINDLLELNVDNIIEMKSFQRAAYGDSANELVISYVDRDQNPATVAVQDLASIQAQGAVISSTQSYPGIREASLASRVGLRDLRTLSSPLAKTVLVTNRVLWDKDKGDVVKLNWPIMGINGAAFRIIDIDKGTLVDGSITVTMVEDIFGLPANSYSAQPVSQWIDTVVPPIAVSASRVVEASYWDVVHTMSLADQRELQEGYGFGLFMASRGAVRSTLNYRIVASPDNVDYVDVGVGHFNPTGNLVDSLTPIVETLTLTGAYDLDNVSLSVDGGYAYIENECLAVLSVDPLTGIVTVKRGILDTVPAAHVAGTKMFFVKQGTGYDTTERVSGETVYYKPLPSTGSGTLPLNDAVAKTLVLANRASRPYPPGNFRVDGSLYPVTVTGPTFTVSWSHRDRSAQTVDFVDYSSGNIGPEVGTTYRLRVWNGATLLRTYDLDGTTTSWSYPSVDDNADGNLATLSVTVNSVRDGIESIYSQGHTFQRLTYFGSVGIEGKPAAPVLSAGSQSFAINLTWLFGDARTNIEKVEIRVSDDPDFNHSTTLQYVNYPDVDYLHELGTALTFKWYWAQVSDTSGQLSPWSNMVSGRSTSSAVTPQDIVDAVQGQIDHSSLTAALASKVDQIDVIQQDITVVKSAVGGTLNSDPNATDQSKWVNGVVITVSGGVTANTALRGGDHGIGNHCYESAFIPRKQGHAYKVSALVRREPTVNSGSFYLGILGKDAAGNIQYASSPYVAYNLYAATLTTDFVRHSVIVSSDNINATLTSISPHIILGYDGANAMAGYIEAQDITIEDMTDGLSAQYTLKVNNNGYVSGFGLASEPVDGVPFSEFVVLADSFRIGAPDGVKTPFAVTQTSPGVWKTLLNSDVVIGGNVDIANLKTGALPNDVVLRLGGGVIELDGAGEIRVFKDLGANADFVRLSSGEIRFLRYISGAYQSYNYLSRLETGIANSGAAVAIPGYWKAQPRVMVSPAILSLFKVAYANQDQAIDCQALNLRESSPGSGQWLFDAVATLNLAAASGGSALNLTSGVISSNTYTTATQTTPANCTTITPSFSLTSVRGNGTSQYFRRTVRWRVEYFNGSWITGAWNIVSMGDQFDAVTSSAAFTFPSASAWQWRIAYEAYDTDTTVFGSITYTYSQTTVYASDIVATVLSLDSSARAVQPTFGAATGSGEIYEITYYATPKVRVSLGTNNTDNSGVYVALCKNYTSGTVYMAGFPGDQKDSSGQTLATKLVGTTLAPLTSSWGTGWTVSSQSSTVSGSNLTFNQKFWSLGADKRSTTYYTSAEFTLTGMSAVIKRRTVATNTTTPSNTFALNSYTYALTTAQVLATGSVNWMAVGE